MRRGTRIGLAAAVAAPLALLLAASPALAGSDITVVNTETVQSHLDATGAVKDSRIYEQLALTGVGTVEISNPVSTQHLRNLDGFGGFTVTDGKMVQTVSVDGQRRLRSVSDYPKALPLTIKATYTLNGRQVDPADVVGASGELEVHYRVENVTGRTMAVSFKDGNGNEITKQAQVVIPMVGSLTTTLPSQFTDVSSGEAAVAGDGRGGTKLTFTMTLFPPIGSAVAEFGWKAKLRAGVVPAATMSALPVQPLASPSFKGGAASYQAGATTGVQLTEGAVQIDDNLLKLRDGAAQLLTGLLVLRDGAEQLSAGLNDKAAPGAAKLAAGVGQLADGNKALAEGFVSPTGKADLVGGSKQLAAALGQIDQGLAQLGGVNGLPSAKAGLQQLRDGITHKAGAGGPSDPGGLLEGVQAVAGGLAGLADSSAGLPAAKGGVDTVKAGLHGGVPQIDSMKAAAAAALARPGCSADLACAGNLQAVVDGLSQLSAETAQAAGGLDQVSAGLSTAIAGVGALKDGALQLEGGIKTQLLPGVDALLAGVTTALGGIGQLSAGAGQADAGAATLAGKIAEAGAGAKKLQSGSAEAATGARDLSSGLGDAAGGSGQLADGLKQAAGGAPQLVDGAQQLSDEGTKKLVEAGDSTATDYGEKYALIAAGSHRAESEGMAYGAPAGAAGATAYTFELAGLDGSGGRNVGRGIGAIAVFGLAAGVAAALRSRLL